MGIDFSEEELQEFRNEASELLDQAETQLMTMDQTTDFNTSYDATFRVFHSLKGGAGMLGMEDLQHHMHKLETQFQNFKAIGKISNEDCSYFLRGVDSSRKLLRGDKMSEFNYSLPSASSGSDEALRAATSAEKSEIEPPAIQNSLPTSAQPGIESSNKNARIYVVDDEPDLVDILTEMLSESGFNVRGFSDPLVFMNTLAKEPPDLVCSDMKMPNVTGLDVLQKVFETDPSIPVIFITGHITKELVIDSLKYGVYGIIEKPFNSTEVLQVVTNAAKRSTLNRLVNRSINLILYQFSDLDEFLEKEGKHQIRKTMTDELKYLLEARRELQLLSKSKR